MKVCELIEHLKKLPQELVVVGLYDEGGTYHDRTEIPVELTIVKSNNPLSYDGKEWTVIHGWGERDGDGGYTKEIIHEQRKVVVV